MEIWDCLNLFLVNKEWSKFLKDERFWKCQFEKDYFIAENPATESYKFLYKLYKRGEKTGKYLFGSLDRGILYEEYKVVVVGVVQN